MNRRCTLLLVIVGLGLAGGLVFLFWRQSAQPLHIKVVRRAVEYGKPVAFFRVEGNGGRRILITEVERVMEDETSVKDFLLSSPFIALGSFGDPGKSRKEFSMPTPPQTRVWKLRVTVKAEMPISRRFKLELKTWKMMRASGNSVWEATRSTLNVFYADAY